MGTGWSKAWKINFWARLLDGDHAQKMVKEILTQSTTNNLLDVHPPFQIDGNFGATFGMTEMLLQSQGGIVKLLPALPSKWAAGSVSGLKARGNVEGAMTWTNGVLSGAELKTGAAGDITVSAPGIGKERITRNGVRVDYEIIDEDTIIINAVAGQVYKVGAFAQIEEPTEQETSTEGTGSDNESKAEVVINGYQISTTVEGYRTVYTVDDPNHEVVAKGMIYGLADYIDESDMVIHSTNTMVKRYAATEAGKCQMSFGFGADAQSYVMTMKFGVKTTEFFDAGICVRAYAELADGTFIYSDVSTVSVYRIADKLYQNQKMNTLESHNYLYENILKIVNQAYQPVDFQWNNAIVGADENFTLSSTQ